MCTTHPGQPQGGMKVGSARELWSESHGRAQQIALTEITTTQDGIILISTATVLSARDMRGQTTQLIETRVFGGKRSDFIANVKSTGAQDLGLRRAAINHAEAILQVVEQYMALG